MVAVFVVGREQRCRFLNNVAEVLTGVPLEYARGRPIRDLLWRGGSVPSDPAGLADRLAAGGGEGEEAIVGNDGVSRRYAFRVVSLDSDAPEGCVVELIDLSSESGTARALRESEQRLRLAVEATGIGIWDVNAITGARGWSAEFRRILGLPADAPADMALFSARIHPEDRTWVDDLYERAYATPEMGGFDAEFRIIRANDGVERWVASNGRITFDRDGRALRGIGTLRDIHERQQAERAIAVSEERNRLAIEANHAGTWDYDMVTGTHLWSDTFKRLWGLDPAVPANPELVYPLVSAADWERIRESWRKGADPAGNGRIELEYQIHRADDGSARWCSFVGVFFFDKGRRKAVRALGIMLDITDQKAAETRQRLVLREMNHRVKNSLAVVQAIVSQTVRTTPDPQAAFERIQSRLMAMARTHDFLNKEDWRGVSVRQLAAGELEPFVANVPGRVELQGEDVILDSSSTLALGLVFHELAVNAMSHGALSSAQGHLRVAWRVEHDENPTLRIEWIESGGARVRRPRSVGFGTRLIEASTRLTLGGAVEIDYLPAGLACHISFPLRTPAYEEALPETAAAD